MRRQNFNGIKPSKKASISYSQWRPGKLLESECSAFTQLLERAQNSKDESLKPLIKLLEEELIAHDEWLTALHEGKENLLEKQQPGNSLNRLQGIYQAHHKAVSIYKKYLKNTKTQTGKQEVLDLFECFGVDRNSIKVNTPEEYGVETTSSETDDHKNAFEIPNIFEDTIERLENLYCWFNWKFLSNMFSQFNKANESNKISSHNQKIIDTITKSLTYTFAHFEVLNFTAKYLVKDADEVIDKAKDLLILLNMAVKTDSELVRWAPIKALCETLFDKDNGGIIRFGWLLTLKNSMNKPLLLRCCTTITSLNTALSKMVKEKGRFSKEEEDDLQQSHEFIQDVLNFKFIPDTIRTAVKLLSSQIKLDAIIDAKKSENAIKQIINKLTQARMAFNLLEGKFTNMPGIDKQAHKAILQSRNFELVLLDQLLYAFKILKMARDLAKHSSYTKEFANSLVRYYAKLDEFMAGINLGIYCQSADPFVLEILQLTCSLLNDTALPVLDDKLRLLLKSEDAPLELCQNSTDQAISIAEQMHTWSVTLAGNTAFTENLAFEKTRQELAVNAYGIQAKFELGESKKTFYSPTAKDFHDKYKDKFIAVMSKLELAFASLCALDESVKLIACSKLGGGGGACNAEYLVGLASKFYQTKTQLITALNNAIMANSKVKKKKIPEREFKEILDAFDSTMLNRLRSIGKLLANATAHSDSNHTAFQWVKEFLDELDTLHKECALNTKHKWLTKNIVDTSVDIIILNTIFKTLPYSLQNDHQACFNGFTLIQRICPHKKIAKRFQKLFDKAKRLKFKELLLSMQDKLYESNNSSNRLAHTIPTCIGFIDILLENEYGESELAPKKPSKKVETRLDGTVKQSSQNYNGSKDDVEKKKVFQLENLINTILKSCSALAGIEKQLLDTIAKLPELCDLSEGDIENFAKHIEFEKHEASLKKSAQAFTVLSSCLDKLNKSGHNGKKFEKQLAAHKAKWDVCTYYLKLLTQWFDIVAFANAEDITTEKMPQYLKELSAAVNTLLSPVIENTNRKKAYRHIDTVVQTYFIKILPVINTKLKTYFDKYGSESSGEDIISYLNNIMCLHSQVEEKLIAAAKQKKKGKVEINLDQLWLHCAEFELMVCDYSATNNSGENNIKQKVFDIYQKLSQPCESTDTNTLDAAIQASKTLLASIEPTSNNNNELKNETTKQHSLGHYFWQMSLKVLAILSKKNADKILEPLKTLVPLIVINSYINSLIVGQLRSDQKNQLKLVMKKIYHVIKEHTIVLVKQDFSNLSKQEANAKTIKLGEFQAQLKLLKEFLQTNFFNDKKVKSLVTAHETNIEKTTKHIQVLEEHIHPKTKQVEVTRVVVQTRKAENKHSSVKIISTHESTTDNIVEEKPKSNKQEPVKKSVTTTRQPRKAAITKNGLKPKRDTAKKKLTASKRKSKSKVKPKNNTQSISQVTNAKSTDVKRKAPPKQNTHTRRSRDKDRQSDVKPSETNGVVKSKQGMNIANNGVCSNGITDKPSWAQIAKGKHKENSDSTKHSGRLVKNKREMKKTIPKLQHEDEDTKSAKKLEAVEIPKQKSPENNLPKLTLFKKTSSVNSETVINLLTPDQKHFVNCMKANTKHFYLVGGAIRDKLFTLNTDVESSSNADFITELPLDHVFELVKAQCFVAGQLFYQNGHQPKLIIPCRDGTSITVRSVNFNKLCDFSQFVDEEKVLRADFTKNGFLTINRVYFNVKTKNLIKFGRCIENIRTKTLRIIGDPIAKIKQDPARIFRILRYGALHNLTVTKDKEQHGDICTSMRELTTTNPEALYHGLCNTFYSGNATSVVEWLEQQKLLEPFVRGVCGNSKFVGDSINALKAFAGSIDTRIKYDYNILNQNNNAENKHIPFLQSVHQFEVSTLFLAILLWPRYNNFISEQKQISVKSVSDMMDIILNLEAESKKLPDSFKDGIKTIWLYHIYQNQLIPDFERPEALVDISNAALKLFSESQEEPSKQLNAKMSGCSNLYLHS